MVAARAPHAVGRDADEDAEQDEVVEGVHGYISVSTVSSPTHTTKMPSTQM